MGKVTTLRHLHKPRAAGTLKSAVAQLVDLLGGVIHAADIAGISRSQMQRCTDDGEPDQLRVDHVRTLETAATARGLEPVVTTFLAAEQGCVLLPVRVEGGRILAAEFAQLGESASALFARYASALADDGTIDAGEAGEMVVKTDRVMAALVACRAALKTKMEGGR